MSYAARYRIPVRSVLGVIWTAEIEQDGYTGTVQELNGSALPIKITYQADEERKIEYIRASTCELSFVSDTFRLEDIIDDNDTKYRLTISDPTRVQWRGFISTDDCTEEYTSWYRTFVLTAFDGLAALKDEDYRTWDTDIAVYGKRTLLEILRDCLQRTYVELPIHIEVNVLESTMDNNPEDNPIEQCQVHTKLFLYADGGPKTMFEILETIMGTFQCTIFQQFGQWHVKRHMDYFGVYGADSILYSWPDLTQEIVTVDWTASAPANFIPINASHVLSFIKPDAFSKIEHDYIIPETPENEAMTRGPLIYSGPDPDDPTVNIRTYYIDFWTYQSGSVLTPDPTAPGTSYRLERDNVDGTLEESYVVLPDQGTTDERLRPETGVFVEAGDTLSLDTQTRLKSDLGGAGTGVVLRLVLYGDSGQKYTWDAATEEWVPTLASAIGSSAFTRTYGGGDNLEEWYPISLNYTSDGRIINTTKPFPEGGLLEMWFCEWSTGTNETWFKDIAIDVKLFQNQVRANFKGEQSVSDNDLTSRRSDERIIRLGDSPKRVIASSLWRGIDDTQLTNGWGRPDEDRDQRLIDINSQDLQKSACRVFKTLEGDFKGISFDDGKLLGPGNLYVLENLTWIVTNIEIDIVNDSCIFRLQEFIDTSKTTPDIDTEFKYLFNERS